MEDKKIINGCCYRRLGKMIFVDLITEKTTEYNIEDFTDYIVEQNIDETYLILSNREGSFVKPLFKANCLKELKKMKKNRISDLSKDEIIDLCYSICIALQKE